MNKKRILKETAAQRANLKCANNGCSNSGAKVCKGCQLIGYCSRECQVGHRKLHKKLCNSMACSANKRRFKQGEALYEAGLNLEENGQFEEALLEYRNALEIFTELFGENDENTVKCHGMIGDMLRMLDRCDDALMEHNKAIAICKGFLGENHSLTANSYELIGNVFLSKGRPHDALIGYGKALEIRLKVLGENDTDTATSHYNIGVALYDGKLYDDALIAYNKALDIYISEVGEFHPRTVTVKETIESLLRWREDTLREDAGDNQPISVDEQDLTCYRYVFTFIFILIIYRNGDSFVRIALFFTVCSKMAGICKLSATHQYIKNRWDHIRKEHDI